jgi:hypothetical protein
MPTDDELDQLLASLGPEVFDDATRWSVDEMLVTGQAVEPALRRKLILAAERGLRVRQLPFEVLAFERRSEAGISLGQLADAIGTSSEQLDSVERRTAALVDQDPLIIARWIHELGVGHELAVVALERSVTTRRSQPAYAAAPIDTDLTDPERSEKAEQFIAAVKAALARLEGA